MGQQKAEDRVVARDLYLKVTDKLGREHIECRTVWDAERFFTSFTEMQEKEGGSVAMSSREEYLAALRK